MLRAQAGVHQQVVHVAQPADLSVDQIFALARSVQPPRDFHFARDRLDDRFRFGRRQRLVRREVVAARGAGRGHGRLRLMAGAVPVAVPIPVSVAMRVAVAVAIAVAVRRSAAFERRAAHGLHEPAEPQTDFCGGRRLARVAAAEDDVFHLVAAQALGALLAHHPRNRVGDVALAAPVRPDDRRHALVEGELGPVGERFEAVDLETFKTHEHHPMGNADCGLRSAD